jgi:hypothetical protein
MSDFHLQTNITVITETENCRADADRLCPKSIVSYMDMRGVDTVEKKREYRITGR